MGEKKKNTWVLPAVITLVFLVMAATGFLMGRVAGVTDTILKQALQHADDVQGADAMKVRLPHIGSAGSSPAATH